MLAGALHSGSAIVCQERFESERALDLIERERVTTMLGWATTLSAINVAGFALGGTDLLVLNGEVRFPITKRLGGAAFVDAGNTFVTIGDLTPGRLALGAGLGVRIRTPLAPFRLDVAYPFSNGYGQRGVRVHFSIGQMF